MFKTLNHKQDRFRHLKLKFGIYLGFACLPVGREFVIWYLKLRDRNPGVENEFRHSIPRVTA